MSDHENARSDCAGWCRRTERGTGVASRRPAWIDPRQVGLADELRRTIDALRDEERVLRERVIALEEQVEDARTEGRRAGLEAGAEEVARAVVALDDALSEAHRELVARATDAVLDVAAALMRDHFEADPAAVTERVAAELAARPHTPVVRVRLSPATCAARDDRSGLEGGLGDVPIIADPTLGPEDAVIELADGQLDLRASTLLAAIRGEVARELGDG